jgi:hypothetical protein
MKLLVSEKPQWSAISAMGMLFLASNEIAFSILSRLRYSPMLQ